MNIKNQILTNYRFKEAAERHQDNPVHKTAINNREVKLVTLNQESVYAQNLPDFFSDLELVVFISRHSSESGTPTLSVHTPGNLGQAELGGLPRKVSFSPASAMQNALRKMKILTNELDLDYEVSYEGTHHGPSLNVPTMFVELGSSSTQWNDLRAAEVVAHAAMEAVSKFDDRTGRVVLGIGGLHYNAKFTQVALESDTAFGHMIPKYAIPEIDALIIKQCIERTLEKVDHVVLDWKGIKGENKSFLVETLHELGMSFEKV